jgi:hypothetical protein
MLYFMIPQELVNQTLLYAANGSPILLLIKIIAIYGNSALVNVTQVNTNTSVVLDFQASIPLFQVWDKPEGNLTTFDGVQAMVEQVHGETLYVDGYNGLVLGYTQGHQTTVLRGASMELEPGFSLGVPTLTQLLHQAPTFKDYAELDVVTLVLAAGWFLLFERIDGFLRRR